MYRLIDEIAQEEIQYYKQISCKNEAERRFKNYKHGFPIKRNYMQGMNVKLIEEDGGYRICLN